MTTNLPIACTLSSDDLRARRESLIPGLMERAEEIEPIEGGYRLRFAPAPNIVAAIAETIELERHCCRFFRFDLTVDPGLGPITLRITGPAGTQQFLAGLLCPTP